jgi:vacuolar-type H+-ATPase subunit H
VTEFDPEATTELNNADAPRFPVVMRGYDRWQVDTRFAELAIQLERERQRADEVEARLAEARRELEAVSNQPPPSFQHLGAEAAKLLEQAGESADRLLSEARERAEAVSADAEQRATTVVAEAERRTAELERNSSSVVSDAEAQAEAIRADAMGIAERERARAEEESRVILAEARDATNMVWQEAQRERVAVEGEIERLDRLRREVLTQLAQVRSQLAAVLDDVEVIEDLDGDEDLDEDDEELDGDEEQLAQAEADPSGRGAAEEPVDDDERDDRDGASTLPGTPPRDDPRMVRGDAPRRR